MLKRIENISISFVPHFLSRKGHINLKIGKYIYSVPLYRLTRSEYADFLSNSKTTPVCFDVGEKAYWLFNDRFYKDDDNLSGDEVKALLLSRHILKQERINRAKTITAGPKINQKPKRNQIPDEIKHIVWQRDGGCCCKCGSQNELQYDHIIPVSLGGASTPENLQILCGTCNRAKKTSVA